MAKRDYYEILGVAKDVNEIPSQVASITRATRKRRADGRFDY